MPPDYEKFLTALPRDKVRTVSRLGLELSADLNAEGWSHLVARLAQTAGRVSQSRDTLTAWLGDVLAYGGGKYHGQIIEYARAAGLSPGTLRDAKLVCSRIPVARRREKLSWTHHCEIGKAFSTLEEIDHWLGVAVKEELSTMTLRKRIRVHVSQSRPVRPPIDLGTFRLLRELRAVDRLLAVDRAHWNTWTPEARRGALAELHTLAEFVATLNVGAVPLHAAS